MNSRKKNILSLKSLMLLCVVVLGLFPGCTGANHPLYDPPPGIVDGKILDPNSGPVDKATVRLENKVANSEAVLTDSGGSFSIKSVNPGTYDLVAEKTISGVKHLARRRFLTVNNKSQINREIKILPGGTLRGVVTLEGRTDHSGIRVDLIGTGRTVVTGVDGSYEFPDLAYTYRDDATNTLFLYDLTFSLDGYANRSLLNISLDAGGLSVLETIQLENLDPAGVATVTGNVTLEARTGAAETVVKILGTAIHEQLILSDGATQGNFEFQDVPAGTYILEISHPDYHTMEKTFTIGAGQNAVDLGTHQLTNVAHFGDQFKAYDLTLSPGGHQIAYIRYEPGSPLTDKEIYIMDVEGVSFNTRISNRALGADDRGMTWSSDGRYIMYVERNPANVARLYRLNAISSSGGDISNLTAYSLDVAQPAFAPVGHRFVYQLFETTGAIFGAELMDKPAGLVIENQVVVVPERNDQVSQNQFSSIEFGVSDRILYSKDSNSAFTVPFSAAGDEGLKFAIPNLGVDTHSVTFSPENDRVAYSRTTAGVQGTYIANVDGSQPLKISDGYGRSLEFSQDGKKLFFVDRRTSHHRKLGTIIVPRNLR